MSVNFIESSFDFLFFGSEEGFKTGGLIGDDSKPISFFATNASEWWKFWEYQVGIKINIGEFSYTFSSGVGEANWSISWNNFSLDIQSGINKIGIGTSTTIDDVTYYNQYYIRTIPTVLAIAVIAAFPAALPFMLAFGL